MISHPGDSRKEQPLRTTGEESSSLPATIRERGAVGPLTEVADRAHGEVSDGGVKDLVTVFKLLSDETRLRILLYLACQREMHVRALCDKLHQSQPAVSHHLALLRVAGLIEPRREGKHNFYRLLPERFQQLLDRVFESVPSDERLIRFEDYVLQYAPAAQLV